MVVSTVYEHMLKLDTDFEDYYDFVLSHGDSKKTYARKYSNSMTKGRALENLKKLGIRTIETKSVRELAPFNDYLVVYTDSKKHRGQGKLIMSSEEAILTYPNYLCSPYIFQEHGVTSKFLQIGKRRFKVILENITPLTCGRLISLDEIEPSYNHIVSLPIFSIDYISTPMGMVAVDFNQVQNLKELSLDSYIEPITIVDEIWLSLYKYNKK